MSQVSTRCQGVVERSNGEIEQCTCEAVLTYYGVAPVAYNLERTVTLCEGHALPLLSREPIGYYSDSDSVMIVYPREMTTFPELEPVSV